MAAYNWGFVSGKTNTIYPWKSWDSTYFDPPAQWHHDIYYENFVPFSYKEVEFIKQTIYSINNEKGFSNKKNNYFFFHFNNVNGFIEVTAD